ncbi:4'-phosphopantetheinyl transferase superfamily protein [Paraglaciecola sp.]|uniref:4'-phosphopantetheinyl transferase family protein n=1 Tax=Paraglaciecola sp. TaxID=1920173 RepID=UPI0030F3E32F
MSLPVNHVHLYYCDIKQNKINDASLLLLLNQNERDRYKKFKNKNRQLQFGLARWLIKQVLYQEFGVCPTQDYQFTDFCRWHVVGTEQQFSVSISHSAQYIAVVVADFSCLIGVDIEQHKKRNFSELLAEFSTPKEQSIIAREPDQQIAFYRLWTAKEAFLKASQLSVAKVSQQDLSNCLLHTSSQVANYCYQTGHIADGCYSYCVMIDTEVLIQLRQLSCIDLVEPDVGL